MKNIIIITLLLLSFNGIAQPPIGCPTCITRILGAVNADSGTYSKNFLTLTVHDTLSDGTIETRYRTDSLWSVVTGGFVNYLDTASMLSPYLKAYIFTTHPAYGITDADINNWNAKQPEIDPNDIERWHNASDSTPMSWQWSPIPKQLSFQYRNGTQNAVVLNNVLTTWDSTLLFYNPRQIDSIMSAGTIKAFATLGEMISYTGAATTYFFTDPILGGVFNRTLSSATVDSGCVYNTLFSASYRLIRNFAGPVLTNWYYQDGGLGVRNDIYIKRAITYAVASLRDVRITAGLTGDLHTSSTIVDVSGHAGWMDGSCRLMPVTVGQVVFRAANNTRWYGLRIDNDTTRNTVSLEIRGQDAFSFGAVKTSFENFYFHGTTGTVGQRGIVGYTTTGTQNIGGILFEGKINNFRVCIDLKSTNLSVVSYNDFRVYAAGDTICKIVRDSEMVNNKNNGVAFNNFDITDVVSLTASVSGNKGIWTNCAYNNYKFNGIKDWVRLAAAGSFADPYYFNFTDVSHHNTLRLTGADGKLIVKDHGQANSVGPSVNTEINLTDFSYITRTGFPGYKLWDSAFIQGMRYLELSGGGNFNVPESDSEYFTSSTIYMPSFVHLKGKGDKSRIHNIARAWNDGIAVALGWGQQGDLNASRKFPIKTVLQSNIVRLDTSMTASDVFKIGQVWSICKAPNVVPESIPGVDSLGPNAPPFWQARKIISVDDLNGYIKFETGFEDSVSVAGDTLRLYLTKFDSSSYNGHANYIVDGATIEDISITSDSSFAIGRSCAYRAKVKRVYMPRSTCLVTGNLLSYCEFDVTGNVTGRACEPAFSAYGKYKFDAVGIDSSREWNEPAVVANFRDEITPRISNFKFGEASAISMREKSKIVGGMIISRVSGPVISIYGSGNSVDGLTYDSHGEISGRLIRSRAGANNNSVTNCTFKTKLASRNIPVIDIAGNDWDISDNKFWVGSSSGLVNAYGTNIRISHNYFEDTASLNIVSGGYSVISDGNTTIKDTLFVIGTQIKATAIPTGTDVDSIVTINSGKILTKGPGLNGITLDYVTKHDSVSAVGIAAPRFRLNLTDHEAVVATGDFLPANLTKNRTWNGPDTSGNLALAISMGGVYYPADSKGTIPLPARQLGRYVSAVQNIASTITWDSSIPSGTTTLKYQWTYDSTTKRVTVVFWLDYGTAGSTNTIVRIAKPSDMPAAALVSGFSSANNIIEYGTGKIQQSKAVSTLNTTAGVRVNSGATDIEFFAQVNTGSVNAGNAFITVSYYAQ